MKYKSELIKDIVDTRGHDKSSLHYESECIEAWIEETKGAYPKLCDYESEWLNYINENPLGEFPYETVTDVTDATVNNVVPYAYKSAILKGSTKYRDIDTGDILDTFDETKNLELVSVKMPVLTTTGKNLNPTRIEPSGLYDSSGTNKNDPSQCRTDDFINVTPNQVLTVSSDQQINRIFGYDADGNYLGIGNGGNILSYGLANKKEHTFTVPNNCYKIKITSFVNTNTYFQLEEGTIATPYEPYKTNILTVNEDITLRGIGDVQDTLDLMTGELTQRIGEVVLDGSQSAMGGGYIKLDNAISDWSGNDKYLLSDKLPTSIFKGSDLSTTPTLALHGALLYVRGFNSNEEITEYFRNNPTTLQYRLANESIKTVDLSIQDQGGNTLRKIKPIEGTMHIHSDGTPLKSTITMEIPVEATTQNLYSFIEEE